MRISREGGSQEIGQIIAACSSERTYSILETQRFHTHTCKTKLFAKVPLLFRTILWVGVHWMTRK